MRIPLRHKAVIIGVVSTMLYKKHNIIHLNLELYGPNRDHRWVWDILNDTYWDKLFAPEQSYQVEILREFYANALPVVDGAEFPYKTWEKVRILISLNMQFFIF